MDVPMAMQESMCLKTCNPKLMSFLISSTSLPTALQGSHGMVLLLELAAVICIGGCINVDCRDSLFCE